MSRRFLVLGERAGYHVVSRVVDRRYVMGEEEKAEFRRLMEGLLGFSGLECLTYCLMSNHFHLLLVVPEAESARADMGDEEFFRRLGCLYPPGVVREVRRRLEELHRRSPAQAEAFRWRYLRRMFSLPIFVQELKRRFARWYNRRHDRVGTLWEERYRSVVVEDGRAMVAMAAYIDLNPVRAGMVAAPGKFRWSGYGEAVRGGSRAQRGLARVLDPERGAGVGSGTVRGAGASATGGEPRREPTWEEIRDTYWSLLSLAMPPAPRDPEQRADGGGTAPPARAGSGSHRSPARGGAPQRTRVRGFVDGLAVGSPAFLEKMFKSHRGWFGPRRKTGARPLQGGGVEPPPDRGERLADGLGCLRDLRHW